MSRNWYWTWRWTRAAALGLVLGNLGVDIPGSIVVLLVLIAFEELRELVDTQKAGVRRA